MRDPNDISAEPSSWFKATEEWLDCHDALTAAAARAAEAESIAADLKTRAGLAYSLGKDDLAHTLRHEASIISDRAKRADAERAKRLREEELIRVGYGPQDLDA